MKLNKNTMIYSVAVLSCSNILLQILGIIYRVIITRLSGAEGLGIYHLAFPFYTVVSSVCITGITVAVTKLSSENPTRARRLIKTAKGIFISLFTLLAILTVVFLDHLAGSVFGDIRTKNVIIGILFCLFFTGFENIYKAYFYGVKHVHPPIASELSEQSIRIIAVTLLLSFVKTTDSGTIAVLIVSAMIISEIISSTFIRIMFYKKSPRNLSPDKSLGSIIQLGFPIALGGLTNNILYAANTIFIPQRLVLSGMTYQQAIEMLGKIFGMVMPVLMLPGVFIVAISTLMMPTISKATANGCNYHTKVKISQTFRSTALIALPAVAFMIALGGEICAELYNQEGMHSYIAAMSASALFVYFEIVSISILNGLGMQKHSQIIIVVTGFIEVLFTYFLSAIPSFGIYGYIIGHIISTFLSMFHGILLIVKYTGVKINFAGWFLLPGLSAAFIGVLSRVIFDSFAIYFPHLIALLMTLALCIGIYLVILRIEGIKMGRHVNKLFG